MKNIGDSPETITIQESTWSAPLSLSDSELVSLRQVREEWVRVSSHWSANSVDADDSRESYVIEFRPESEARWRVKVNDAIGAIDLGTKLLVFTPKIPLAHFTYIAERALVPADRLRLDKAKLASGESFLELIARWTLFAIEKVVRDGLIRGYTELEMRSPFIQGKIDLMRSTRNVYRGDLHFETKVEEFSANNALNRSLKQALKFINQNRILPDELRIGSSRALRHFGEVGEFKARDLNAPISRSSLRYTESLEFSRHLLVGVGRSLSSGSSRSHSFLYKTPALIEEGIRRIVQEGLSPTKVIKRSREMLTSPRTRYVSVNPDLTFEKNQNTGSMLVGDIKYKIQSKVWRRADLAQAVFFAAAFESPKALVLDFIDNDEFEGLGDVAIGEIAVSVLGWDVSEDSKPTDSAQRLISEVSQWLDADKLYLINEQNRLVS
jgi:5-methylcytosine-specific restriction enzyme subunit McrC